MFCTQCGSSLDAGTAVCRVCGSKASPTVPDAEPQVASAVSTRRWVVRGVIAAIVIGGILIFADQLLRTYHPVVSDQPVVAMTTVYSETRIPSVQVDALMENGFITISLNDVKNHKLVRFFDPEGKQQIPMIAYVTPTGKLVTAMSTSEHCGSRDFYLQGNNIHCANCASYWNMSSLEAYACCARYYPDPIPSAVSGDRVRIDPSRVRTWESRL